jgi:hypothetical protein
MLGCGFRGAFFRPGFGRFGFGHPGFFRPGFGRFGFGHPGFFRPEFSPAWPKGQRNCHRHADKQLKAPNKLETHPPFQISLATTIC